MNLSTLLKQIDDLESGAPSFKKYINESIYRSPEMTTHWRKLDEGFFKGYDQYLKEVALTPDQIQNIFKQAGGGAQAGADAAKDPGKLEKIVDKVLPVDQAANLEKSLPEPDAGPVQGFEQKAAAAVQNIQGADSATKQSLMQWVKGGLQKPETQQLILAALSAGIGGLISKVGPILSMIPGGGPVVSAITGAVIAGAVAVASAKMQGKDWKSAFKGAIKPALMGGASAVVGNLAATAIGAMTSGGGTDAAASDQASGKNDQLAGGQSSSGIRVAGQDVIPGQPLTATQMAVVDQSIMSGNTPSPEVQAAYDLAKQQGPSAYDNNPAANGQKELTPAQSDRMTAMQMQAGSLAAGHPTAANPADAGKTGADFAGTRDANGVAPYATGSGAWAADRAAGKIPDLPIDGGSSSAGSSDYPSAGKVRPSLDQWRTDTGSPNAPQPVTPSTPSDGSYKQAAPIGANGQPMQQVPMDEPPAQITPRLPPGASLSDFSNTAGAAPADTSTAPQGAAMDPEYLKRVVAGEPGRHMITPDKAQAALDWQAQNGGQVQPPKGTWSDGGRASYPGGLAQYYKDHPGIRENAVNKQATLREWLKRDQQGVAINSVQLNPIFVEGIFDFFKGGKKDNPAKTEPTMGASVDSLNQAWKAAGSPTDSDEVAKILQGAGIAPEAVAKIYTDLKIPAPGAAPADQAATAPADQAATAPADQAATAPADQAATAPAPDATQVAQAGSTKQPATSAGAEPPATPQADKQSKIGVGQINKIVPTLRVRDLKSVQKNVDATLAKRGKTAPAPQPTAEGKYVGFYSKFLGKEI